MALRRLVGLLVAAAVLAAGACSKQHRDSAAAVAAPPCQLLNLRVVLVESRVRAPAKHHALAGSIGNLGDAACSLNGYPELTFVDTENKVMPFVVSHRTGPLVRHVTPARVGVPAGHAVYFLVDKMQCSNAAGATLATVGVRVPGDVSETHLAVTASGYDACPTGDSGNTVTVSAIVADVHEVLTK